MSRKNRAPKRDVLPDPLYNSQLVTRLINRVMLDGKRGTAASIVYGAFEQIKEATGNDALEVFETAMENIMPVLEVRARRVGGSNYQVPVEVRPERRTTLGLRWLVTIARQRGEHTMVDRLAKEILDAANNTGAAVKKREDTHRMAEANRAFAHFRGKIMMLGTVRMQGENRKLMQYSTNTRKFIFFTQHPVPAQIG